MWPAEAAFSPRWGWAHPSAEQEAESLRSKAAQAPEHLPLPDPHSHQTTVRVRANSMPRRSASLLREEKKLSPKGLQDPSCLPWPTQRLAMRLDPEGDGSQGVKEKAGWGAFVDTGTV